MSLSKNKTADRVYQVVCSIPKGSVMTYKEVAEKANVANPRYIGYILHQNPDQSTIPCHRVIRSDGTVADGFAFGGKDKQIEMLKKEGVVFVNNRIVLGN